MKKIRYTQSSQLSKNIPDGKITTKLSLILAETPESMGGIKPNVLAD